MSLELALRMTEILLAFAFLQQSAEHLAGFRNEQVIYGPRLVLSGFLLFGIATPWMLLGLLGLGLMILQRFQGPYNGGSDKMSLLVLCCLTAARWLPSEQWQEYAFAYLAGQLVICYFISGQVKIVNPEWRSGRALQDVFRFSAYPVSEDLRGLADRPRLLWAMGWAVMSFEVLFPLALFSREALVLALFTAALFHLANACLFGLNRFFWIWLAAYPSLFWLQDRVVL
ncbi:HTTM domain-containing protein [Leisingera sp. MMG026]|uniref:HTTM domain-containing protein n=2 Tax=unclassified Leisingera TaxID=2614906 RepID=UPI001EFFCE44|nr:HTTM domain-containing protein [Leisingera sp. MMG026]MCF6432052.1 HTTM domain-containing protein [Leisingera sp. MMG026]